MTVDTGVLIALINGAVLAVGYLFTRRGVKEVNRQQVAANLLSEREADWKRRGDVIADQDEIIQKKDARIAHLLQVCTLSHAASVETIATLKQVLRDEVAKEIADLEIQRALKHEKTEH